MGSPPVSARAARCQPITLNALIANLSPITTPPRDRPPNRKALRRFRPILGAIPVGPAMVCIQKFELGAPRGVAYPPSVAQEPAGVRLCAPRPIKLVRERPKVGPRSAPELHSANAAAQTTVREKHSQGTRDSLEAARPASSTVAKPRKRAPKRKQLNELLKSSLFLAKLKTLKLDAVTQLGHFMSGVCRVAARAVAVVVVVLGLGFLVSTNRALLTAAEENITPRAAFLMEDNFGGGAGDGWHVPHYLVADESGGVRVEGLVLHRETMGLSSYRMDFEAKLSPGAVGWVIGAQDHENYHLYKLEKAAPSSENPYRIVHYPVVGGEPDTTKAVSTEVSLELNEHIVHRFSVRVREGRILTLINGESVDYWVPQEWKAGGIGFFGNESAASLICYVTAYSNQDFLGLSLAAALDAIKSFQGFLDGSA